jgi:hypothetical protein
MKMIGERSRLHAVWNLLILLLVLATCFLVPFQVAFRHQVNLEGSILLYLIDLFFLLDIFFNFRTTYRSQGREVTDRDRIARHYIQTFLVIDLLASIPFDALLLPWRDYQIGGVSIVLLLRLLRLLRVVRLSVVFRYWQRQSWANVGLLRIAKLAVVIVVLTHWIACGWFLTAYVERFPEDSWVATQSIEEADVPTQYVRSLYWAIVTMTSVGYGDIVPVRNPEYLFTMLAIALGASIWAFVIGNIASLLSNLDRAKTDFWSRVETESQYLRRRQAPAKLNDHIRDYYEYVWERYRGTSEQELFADLPAPVRLEILLHLTRDLLEKVPLFLHCTAALRNALLMALKPQIFGPGVYVIREGEVGNEIYFISRGTVAITSEEGHKSHGTLGSGEYFGDLSMLLGERRTASVAAVSYCELFVLERSDFNKIKNEYEEFREVLKTISSEKSERLTALVLDGVVL